MRNKKYILNLIIAVFVCITVCFGSTIIEIQAALKQKVWTPNLKKTTATLYVGGSRGTASDGKKSSKLKYLNVRKQFEGFDETLYDIKLKSSDSSIASVSGKKDRVYPKSIGHADITVTIKNIKTGKKIYTGNISVTVKKNADSRTTKVTGIEDGDVFEVGESVLVSLPADNDTDLRKFTCRDNSVEIAETASKNTYSVVFTEAGEYTLEAMSYQSKKYDGPTSTASVTVSVEQDETGLRQLTDSSVEIIGGCVYEDLMVSDISTYEISDGIRSNFSNAKKAEVSDNKVVVSFFKNFEGGKKYLIVIDGEEIEFVASGNEPEDIRAILSDMNEIPIGKQTPLRFRYINSDGVDITNSVADKIKDSLSVKIDDADETTAFLVMDAIYGIRADEEVKLSVELRVDCTSGAAGTADSTSKPGAGASDASATGTENKNGALDNISGNTVRYETTETGKTIRIISAEFVLHTIDNSKSTYTGKYIYSFEKSDGKYLKPEDVLHHSLAEKDELSFEVLLLFDDGKYRTPEEAGITDIFVADPKIAMVTSKNADGGYSVSVNSVGNTGMLLKSGEKIIEAIPFETGEARKATELVTEVNKTKLNTDIYVGDYLIIKAEVIDQYGEKLVPKNITIKQTEGSINSVGYVYFGQFHDGRLVVNGYDCDTQGRTGYVRAQIAAEGLEKETAFMVKEVPYDYYKQEQYEYTVKTEGPEYIDTALYRGKPDIESTFVTSVTELDGYYVGEGTGEILSEKPSMIKTASEYGIAPGETMMAVLIEREKFGSTEKEIITGHPCIIQSYMDIEFAPYTAKTQLPEGNYTVTFYLIKGGETVSQVKEVAKTELMVFDSKPDIEFTLVSEKAEKKDSEDWPTAVAKCFTFTLDGTDISDCIANVEYNVSGTGSIYVKSAEFSIPNTVYGKFSRSVDIGKLITGYDSHK